MAAAAAAARGTVNPISKIFHVKILGEGGGAGRGLRNKRPHGSPYVTTWRLCGFLGAFPFDASFLLHRVAPRVSKAADPMIYYTQRRLREKRSIIGDVNSRTAPSELAGLMVRLGDRTGIAGTDRMDRGMNARNIWIALPIVSPPLSFPLPRNWWQRDV